MNRKNAIVAALSGLLLAACGRGHGDPVGFWSNRDGGPGATVFRYSGQPAWDPVDFVFPSVNLIISGACSNYRTEPDGGIERADNPPASQVSLLQPASEGWRLALDFTDLNNQSVIDRGYRAVHRNRDGGTIEGTVQAQFTGTLTLRGDAVSVDYRVEYRDAAKVLAADDGHLALPRSVACK